MLEEFSEPIVKGVLATWRAARRHERSLHKNPPTPWVTLLHLFDTDGFPPRWQCGDGWTQPLGWLHVLSDLAIWGAYFAIPTVIIILLVKRRQDVPFPRLLFLFAGFILLCGTTHLIESIIFWHPVYRLAGVVKCATAIISWVTVIALIRVGPLALKLPGMVEMNQTLTTANIELEEANTELDEFSRGVSHDLKAPLRGIISLTEWLAEDLEGLDNPEVMENLELLQSRTNRIAKYVDGMLACSRFRHFEPHPIRIDSRKHILEAWDLLDGSGQATFVAAEDLPEVVCDETLFQAVVINLLSNAIKYGGGEVQVVARRDENAWIFGIKDNGKGIEEKNIERMMKPFETLQPRDEQESTGLGLSIVQKALDRMGSRLEISSELGKGTTCEFRVVDRTILEQEKVS